MGAINFTNALGIHDNAMQLRAQRAEVLANNLANADTPGFKARDFDFKAILEAETHSNTSFGMAATHSAHLSGTSGFADDELAWQLLPNQKLERLEHWRTNETVGMVGDGINDAPALAAADLGIAVGTGTQIAQDTADLVLLGDRLEALPEALTLARRTMAKIRQNLFWAFGYNMIALPVAAGALLPGFNLLLSPPLAALLMALSSVSVVLNALSLSVR